MHFIGLDLAWGERRPTGVAVLDDAGHLLHVSAVQTDDEVAESLASYVEGDCLVAIDAPLVVVNETGARPAERALNRDFGRFDAGAHPSNTGKPEFSPVPRGARLAARLGLDLDPDSRARRRAIEVYPHPATVALFGLGRTLKYKNKPGRPLATLREELLALVRLLEGLAAADPALHLLANDDWRALVEQAESATRKSELRQVEDQVDAVVCAYVAFFRERRPDDTTTYGDLAEGYIVTPTLRAGQQPSPRPPRTPPRVEVLRRAIADYAELQPRLQQAATDAVEIVQSVLDEAGLNYLTVTGRAKSVASFAAKAARTVDDEPVYLDPLADMTDVIGVRVITYVHSDVAAVAGLLSEEAELLDDRDLGQETAGEGRFGYASRHLQLRLGEEQQREYPAIGSRQVQVQIRTVLQHAWAEFEHDIRYKGSIPDEHRADFDRRFTLAAGLLELADQEFSTIRQRLTTAHLTPSLDDDEDPRISPQELAAFLAGQYADSGWSRPDHYSWIAGLLLELGVTSLGELSELVRSVDSALIDERLGYRHVPGAVRRLDDALLFARGEDYVGLHGNAHRIERLRERLGRMQG